MTRNNFTHVKNQLDGLYEITIMRNFQQPQFIQTEESVVETTMARIGQDYIKTQMEMAQAQLEANPQNSGAKRYVESVKKILSTTKRRKTKLKSALFK